MYTDYHSQFWAHALTLKSASDSIHNLSRSIANTKFDLNPHQVDAALFAFRSPLTKGAILADEVGLGKTIEAGTRPEDDDIVLDFFAGSAVTGHAVMKQNLADEGNRRFVLVQLPEPLPKPEQGLNTIYDMGGARLRNITDEITTDENGKLEGVTSTELLPLLGFRKLKLTESNFKIWDGSEDSTPEALQEQLQLFADHVLPDRSEQDILCELMLKAGLSLTAAIEEKTVANQKVYSIAEGLLFICLANPITQECLRGMAELEPQRVICLDAAFGGNDQLKTNTVLEMKSHGIEFRTV